MGRLGQFAAVWLLATLGTSGLAAAAVTAQDVRGGWETYVDGVEHIYELHVEGQKVTGAYCTVCSDAETVAFLDGVLEPDGVSFVVTHLRDDGSTDFRERVRATISDGHFIAKGERIGGGGAFQWTMNRDPRGPTPAAPPAPNAPPPQQYSTDPPGPWQAVTMAKVEGVWLSRPGPNKQYFLIRKYGKGYRGLACGPCSNPYTMGLIDDFRIEGDTLRFNIFHEDWGTGPLPYEHRAAARLRDNEMRMDMVQSNGPRLFSMTVLGPLAFKATHERAAP